MYFILVAEIKSFWNNLRIAMMEIYNLMIDAINLSFCLWRPNDHKRRRFDDGNSIKFDGCFQCKCSYLDYCFDFQRQLSRVQ
ncbi:unnamed protein product [Paramecium octaurelia]|uniref:Uncharacterized protein n=1 Tax=Paramecium octaurelia TaxID=43137 RepID=A0A8S1URL0_PAROT|nr:unnamed protein product [Paramecium octaurelia]